MHFNPADFFIDLISIDTQVPQRRHTDHHAVMWQYHDGMQCRPATQSDDKGESDRHRIEVLAAAAETARKNSTGQRTTATSEDGGKVRDGKSSECGAT